MNRLLVPTILTVFAALLAPSNVSACENTWVYTDLELVEEAVPECLTTSADFDEVSPSILFQNDCTIDLLVRSDKGIEEVINAASSRELSLSLLGYDPYFDPLPEGRFPIELTWSRSTGDSGSIVYEAEGEGTSGCGGAGIACSAATPSSALPGLAPLLAIGALCGFLWGRRRQAC